MVSIGIGGFLAIDYNTARQWASAEDKAGLTFREYLGGFSQRLARATGSADAPRLPTALTDMLPRPPEGWTVRAAVPEDIQPFLPRRAETASPEGRQILEGLVTPAGGNGVESVQLTYERGERRVVIKAVRYPDVIFTSFTAMTQRFELQMRSASLQTTPFMTVRGLDVAEEILPPELRARLFVADVGAQIHLRVLASDRLADADLVPFFQTLHVPAMNASVVDKQDGLGQVPVIVLASAMADIEREAYAADLAAREAEAIRLAEAARQAAEAEAAAAAPQGQGPTEGFGANCETGPGGIKRCSVGGN